MEADSPLSSAPQDPAAPGGSPEPLTPVPRPGGFPVEPPRSSSRGDAAPVTPDPDNPVFRRALEILRGEAQQTPGPQSQTPSGSSACSASSACSVVNPPQTEQESIPARMLNEFVYCPRLFYYEYVESVFVDSADTLRGSAIHRRVDSGRGALPAAEAKGEAQRPKAKVQGEAAEGEKQKAGKQKAEIATGEPETIHSRSVQMGSERLGVVAKMDLVEVRPVGNTSEVQAAGAEPRASTGAGQPATGRQQTDFTQRLFTRWEVCPVDYKAGAPREGAEANELWDADKMQLGLQVLILRDNGYTCREGIIYYRATRQRVRFEVTPEVEAWIIERIAEARRVAAGTIPSPLVNSPKCPRCSLAPICLPDETRLLAAAPAALSPLAARLSPSGTSPSTPVAPTLDAEAAMAPLPGASVGSIESAKSKPKAPRRLIAPRDDCRALYLNTPGLRVGIKDEVLQVKEEKALLDEVRVNDLTHVALFGNIQISTQALQALCEAEVPVTYFSMGGWFYGITRGHALKNVFLRIEQFRQVRDGDTALRVSRQFVNGKIRNQRTMLMRNHIEAPPAALLKLKQAADAALRARTLEELLGIEGGAAAAYFEQFGGMIKIENDLAGPPQLPPARPALSFNFTHRNRRPPTDPVNAMLSLAYSLLAKDCLLAVLAVGFDPYVGFYHQPRFGRPALALDLMEEFRALVAESVVLSCINNRTITESDFVRAGEAVNLTTAGRRRFFQVYEQRMSSLLTHPLFDYKVCYRRALELQARLLGKTLTGEIPHYAPLTTR